jgi:hypothetical protein
VGALSAVAEEATRPRYEGNYQIVKERLLVAIDMSESEIATAPQGFGRLDQSRVKTPTPRS